MARSIARPTAGGRRHKNDLVELAMDPQDTVPVGLADLLDVGAGGLEDEQSKQPEHGNQGEVVDVLRVFSGGEPRAWPTTPARQLARAGNSQSSGLTASVTVSGGALQAPVAQQHHPSGIQLRRPRRLSGSRAC